MDYFRVVSFDTTNVLCNNERLSIILAADTTNNGDMLLDFVPYNNIPMGIDFFRGRLFITIPRLNPGVPSTLNQLQMNPYDPDKCPLLKPFPDIVTNGLHVSFPCDLNSKLISSDFV